MGVVDVIFVFLKVCIEAIIILFVTVIFVYIYISYENYFKRVNAVLLLNFFFIFFPLFL